MLRYLSSRQTLSNTQINTFMRTMASQAHKTSIVWFKNTDQVRYLVRYPALHPCIADFAASA